MKISPGNIIRGLHGHLQNLFDKPAQHQADLQPFEIGKSAEGRPIHCFKIGNGPNKILYFSAIHGNEIGTVKLAHHLTIWAHKNINNLQNHTLYIIPCLNPDGYAQAIQHPQYFSGGKIGRFNAHNVDLNRNFDTPGFAEKSLWSFGQNYAENTEVYCGESGNSEPETKALTEFIRSEKIQTVFAFHNVGSDVLASKDPLAEKLAKIYSEKTGFRQISEDEWLKFKQTGTAKEWCEINNIAYVEIEGSTRWGSDWKIQKKAIEATFI